MWELSREDAGCRPVGPCTLQDRALWARERPCTREHLCQGVQQSAVGQGHTDMPVGTLILLSI